MGKSFKNASYHCHTGTIEVFKDPRTQCPYFGGGSSRGLVIHADHLIVAMANIDTEAVAIRHFDAPRLSRYNNKTVRVFCEDFGVPALGKQFWIDLVETVNDLWASGQIKGVTACCMGGHGRTGTALAILAGLTGACTSDPVLFVREHYCGKAVEANCQLDYVQEVTGIKVAAKPTGFSYQSSFSWKDDDDYDGYHGYRGLADYAKKKPLVVDGTETDSPVVDIELFDEQTGETATVNALPVDDIDRWISGEAQRALGFTQETHI